VIIAVGRAGEGGRKGAHWGTLPTTQAAINRRRLWCEPQENGHGAPEGQLNMVESKVWQARDEVGLGALSE
jgi:hypothetical protein